MHISNLELWWRQSLELTLASIKSRYRKTLAGFLWVLLNPVITFGVQALVFRKFLRLEIHDYYLFLVGGLIPWIFMSQTVQMGTPLLAGNGTLLRSFRLQPLVLITSSVLDNFVNFVLSILIIVIPVSLTSQAGFTWHALWAPLCLLPMLIGVCALTAGMSLLNVFYRDTNFVLSFIFSVLFFLTPVFYPSSFVPAEFRWIVDFNPLYHFIAPFRAALHPLEGANWFHLWLVSMGWALGLSLLSFMYWRRKRNEIFIAL